jgi:membrane protease YdiL (CAAX protease family)
MTTPEPDEGEGGPATSGREDVGTAFVADAPPSLPKRAKEPDRPPAAPFRDARGWAAIAVVIAFIGAGAHFAFDLERAGQVWFWVLAIGPTVIVAAFALVRAARDGELAELVQPAWGDATRGLLSAAVLLGGSVLALRVLAPNGSPRESWVARLYLQLGDPTWLRAHAAVMAMVVLLAAAAEEIVWRGLVTRLIAEKIGSRWAWVWAAIPYALAHAPTAWALRDPEAGLNPLLVLGALGLGLFWGGLARSQRRLAPSILSHAAFDWCVLMVFRLWGSGV